MDMVFQYYITVDFELFVVLSPDEGIKDNLYGGWPGENGEPVEDGKGEEVGGVVVGYFIAAASHFLFPCAALELRRSV